MKILTWALILKSLWGECTYCIYVGVYVILKRHFLCLEGSPIQFKGQSGYAHQYAEEPKDCDVEALPNGLESTPGWYLIFLFVGLLYLLVPCCRHGVQHKSLLLLDSAYSTTMATYFVGTT